MEIHSVSEVTNFIKRMFQREPVLGCIQVRGELSNFRCYASGHCYFTLKDANSCIKCVMFRSRAQGLRFRPENGMQVVVSGNISVYERDGVYQIYADRMMPEGAGDLALAFEQLKARLAAEGLFDAAHKKPLPRFPKRIGIVTSISGAVLRDIYHVSKRRWPSVQLVLKPVLVQGEEAAAQIAAAIAFFNEKYPVDVLIVGRGGGSMEDLWAFNEESVARAIFASELPVISAVGHETDFTIADFVSDLRAPTPSAAAELATTRLADKKEDARALAERLERDMQAVLTVSKRRLEFLKERPVLKRPLELMQKKERVLAEQERLLYKETAGQLQRLSRGLLAAEGRLAAVSPFSVMNRGYAMLMDEGGTPLTTAQAAKVGQAVRIRMKDGILQAEVTGKAVFADGEKETNL